MQLRCLPAGLCVGENYDGQNASEGKFRVLQEDLVAAQVAAARLGHVDVVRVPLAYPYRSVCFGGFRGQGCGVCQVAAEVVPAALCGGAWAAAVHDRDCLS